MTQRTQTTAPAAQAATSPIFTAGLIPYAPLNEKQTRYIILSQVAWFNVLEGGKRASKNITNLIAWAMILENHPDKLHLAGGYTQATAKINIIDSNGYGLRHIFHGRCREGIYDNVDALFIQTRTGEKIVLITGGGKSNDDARIKGFSVGTCYITEANECHPTYIKESFDRVLHSTQRRIFHDLNPKGPSQWYYTEVLDFHEKQQKKNPRYGLNYAHMTLVDNMAMTPAQLREAFSTYDHGSLWFRREILGLRAGAEGKIYTSFSRDRHVWSYDKLREHLEQNPFSFFTIGVDFGGSSSASVFNLTGFTRNFRKAVVLDEYYDSANFSADHLKAAWIERANRWARTYPRILGAYMDHEILLVKSFRQATPNINIRLARKGPISGRISATDMMMATDRLVILENCRHLIDAFDSAVWDPKRPDDLVRLDDGSVNIDSLDAFEYATENHYRDMLRI